MSELVAIPRDESSHWYDREGNPCHTQPYASGKPGQRPTTLGDARKLGLAPSVSKIQDVIAKPGIVNWSLRLHLEEALTNPTGDPADVIRRVKEAKAEAPDLGTAYHRELEKLAANWWRIGEFEVLPHDTVEGVRLGALELGIIVEATEISFRHPLGYGGCSDLVGWWRPDDPFNPRRRLVLDWKTTETGPRKPPRAWPDHVVQLAAYAHGIVEGDADLLSVIISRTEPGRICWHRWSAEEAAIGWRKFQLMLELWKLENNYDPGGEHHE
jgi:hypothetical protein